MANKDFVMGVERLVNPIDVGTIHFIQQFNGMLPKGVQKKMVESSGKKTPYMGFVVEPYSYFLCYEIQDLKGATALLPDGYRLIKTQVFEEDEPRYYGIFGCFNAHTSGFWGMRVEFYIIAEDEATGLLSWIIVDYDTNTITYDPKHGLSDPNASGSHITIDYNGTIYADVENNSGRKLIFHSKTKHGATRKLDKRLWVEGNLSIAYGRSKIESDPGKFSLTFDPDEFQEAIQIDLDDLTIETNNWFPNLLNEAPTMALCFPYAQHFLSDSPGHNSEIMNEQGLVDKVRRMDFSNIQVFSTAPFKRMMVMGGMISFAINALLVMLLVAK